MTRKRTHKTASRELLPSTGHASRSSLSSQYSAGRVPLSAGGASDQRKQCRGSRRCLARRTKQEALSLSLSFSPSVLRGGTCGARKLSRASCSPPAAPDQRFPRASSIRVPRVTDPQSQREKRPFLPDTIVVALIRGMRGTTAEDVHTRNVRRTSCLLLTYSGERRASRSATQS